MDAQLEQVLSTVKRAVEAFEGPLAQDVDAALSLSPDHPTSQSGALRTKIEETIQTLHILERMITPPQVLFMDAIFAATNTKVLLCAHRYHFADILASHGPLTLPALATASSVQPSATQQLLRYLIEHLGIFAYASADRSAQATVCNNRASALLRTDHWTTWHHWVDQYATTHYDMLSHLPEAVSAEQAGGRSAAQQYWDSDESTYVIMQARGLTAGFHRAIGAFSVAEAPGLLADYAWGEALVGGDGVEPSVGIVDVGAGQGDFIAQFLQAFPKARATAFDLPGTAALIRERFEREEERKLVGDRVNVVAGDFFADGRNDLPKSEVYFLRLVLHNWDDERCVRILKRVREAMMLKEGVSRVLVVENVVRDGRAGSFARYGDVRMLAMVKGRERTLEEYRGIAKEAGFVIRDVVTPRGCLSQVMELWPVE